MLGSHMGPHSERVSTSANLTGFLEEQDDVRRVLLAGWGDVFLLSQGWVCGL